jgi:methanogenic corrinoid protein MtbC1
MNWECEAKKRSAFGEGYALSHDLQLTPMKHHDSARDELSALREILSPVVEPSEGHLHEFASVIENVIVPRLLMSHIHSNKVLARKKAALDEIGVQDFIDLTMDQEPDAAIEFVQGLLDDGIAFQDILLRLMAPAARELGERWVHDSASFVEVTLGVARMHRILREFDGIPGHMWSQGGAGRHALLLPVPGENHTFGLRLVQEFLLRESWRVSDHPVQRVEEIARLVADQSFDVVGLSLSGETLIDSLRFAISSIRSHSRNPSTKIIIGGHIFVERPELVSTMGADAYAPDAPSTVSLVNRWAGEMATGK